MLRDQKTGQKVTDSRKRFVSTAVAATALLAGGLAAIPGTASASSTGSQACEPDISYRVTKFGGPTYGSLGSVVGKRNSSSSKATLKWSIKTTKSRSSKWLFGGGGSINWGIVKIEGKTSYDVTKKVSSGNTVTNTMKVGAHKRGFMQPMVMYRKFNISKMRQNGNCTWVELKEWNMKAIVADLVFAECQTKHRSCKPKP
ncbi:hypothetical protein ACQB60_36175 [Actinomycetota bacterium Odt1-20B]